MRVQGTDQASHQAVLTEFSLAGEARCMTETGHAASGRAKKPSDRATQGSSPAKNTGKSDYSIARSALEVTGTSVFTLIGTLPWVAGVRKSRSRSFAFDKLSVRMTSLSDDNQAALLPTFFLRPDT